MAGSKITWLRKGKTLIIGIDRDNVLHVVHDFEFNGSEVTGRPHRTYTDPVEAIAHYIDALSQKITQSLSGQIADYIEENQ